ncbi:MEDS domain-containing protein [Dermatobacter hominis]|uniref:MEDS domain-containing protein n=1 Tax=Dermatobacter hominis TaxID=2884263 RepID=UPI001D119A95|nr:MEDS domain-containing protein [Dermatobacter hominis]UDY37613.1 MEDS domain-containing protein [Dermatobacter hominis]
MNAVAVAPGALDHTAVFHRGPAELAATMCEPLGEALDRGEAVLVSLTPDAWDPLRSALGRAAETVRWLHADDRYATPAGAMQALNRFVVESLGAGAPSMWSLGALTFDGSERDRAWMRYEHAVNDVMADVPLHAVCAYDLVLTPADALAHARSSHSGCHGEALGVIPTAPSDLMGGASGLDVPVEASVVDAVVETAASARSQVGVLSGSVPAPLLDDLRLAVSELVSNAVRYGSAPVRMTVWALPGSILLRVHDTGSGIRDPFADLRPAAPDARGGRGLGIVAQLGQLHFGHDDTGTSVTVVFDLGSG